MGLFDKKFCSVCGEKIGLFGNMKLVDGNLCRNCRKKLSPFYKADGATVTDIRTHLQYREQNRAALRYFNADKVIGADQPIGPDRKLCIDSHHGKFLFSVKNEMEAENPDVFDLASLRDIRFYIQEFTDRENPAANIDYYYTFYLTLSIDHTIIHELEFKLNNRSVITCKRINENQIRDVYEGRSDMGDVHSSLKADDRARVEYLKYYTVLNDMAGSLAEASQIQLAATSESHTVPRFCPHCGASVRGSATFSVSSDDKYAKTGAKYLTDYDLKFREKWEERKALQIKYLSMYPKLSDAAENTKNNIISTILRIAGIALAFLLIILALKPNKKRK